MINNFVIFISNNSPKRLMFISIAVENSSVDFIVIVFNNFLFSDRIKITSGPDEVEMRFVNDFVVYQTKNKSFYENWFENFRNIPNKRCTIGSSFVQI